MQFKPHCAHANLQTDAGRDDSDDSDDSGLHDRLTQGD
jgi:hypothetical protein